MLEQLRRRELLIGSPTLLFVEVAGAVARALNDTAQGVAMAHALRGLPNHTWAPLDDLLTDEAAELAAERRVRGADAVYAAVARLYGTTLVTRDRQQLERLSSAVVVITPEEALLRLD